jgi:multidrug efflux pump
VISAPFIRRPIASSLLMAAVLIAGFAAFRQLGIAALPAIDLPTIRVLAALPGASPETMASSVARPLERQLGQISGISELTSISTLGQTTILVQFELTRSIDDAARDVSAAINAAANLLPKDMPNPPIYRKTNPSQAPLVVLAITCDTLPADKVFDYADSIIAQKLSEIEGVSEVTVSGAEKSAVRVQLDPAALWAAGLDFEDVRDAVARTGVIRPKGSLDGSRQAYAVTANDQLFTAHAYGKVIVGHAAGSTVRLKDLGKVVDSVADTRTGGWFNGKRAVIVVVMREPGANVVETAARVRNALPQLQRWMPPAIKTEILVDRTATIRAAVTEIGHVLLVSILLVIVGVFIFLRHLVATIIPCTVIPVAIAGTSGVMYLCGYTLDNLSLLALAVASGFMIDDAIVMTENIARFREAGHGPIEAALLGSRQITFTILAITASLLAAFAPLFLLPGIVGRFFVEFAVTLSAAVIISAIVSLTAVPMMCARFLGAKTAARPGAMERLGERLSEGLLDLYRRSLIRCLAYRPALLLATLLALGGTIWLYIVVPKGFIPEQDTGVISGITEASQDTSYAAMAERQGLVVNALLTDPAVVSVGSFLGPVGVGGISNGRLYINLKPAAGRGETIRAVIDRLRPALEGIPGIRTFLVPLQDFAYGARQSKGLYQYTLQDDNLVEMQRWLPRVRDRLAGLPQLRDVGTDQQAQGLQARLTIDRDAASRLGISPQMIDETLYDAFGQRQIATIYTPLDQYHVILEADPASRGTLEALQSIYVKSASGKQVPLSALVRMEPGITALSVSHQGQFAAVTITFNLATGTSLSEAIEAINAAFESLQPPGTLHANFAGNAAAFRSTAIAQPMMVVAALGIIYIVLGALYESYVHPLTILSTLPSAGLGALLALIVTGTELSLMALIGIFFLIGIVKKNAILMVDFALYAERQQGLAPVQAIVEAAVQRFRPIVMTTLAALCSVVPVAIGSGPGSELRRPLGIAVIGGLLVSQVLTLYSTPVIFLYLNRFRRRRGALRQPPATMLPAP